MKYKYKYKHIVDWPKFLGVCGGIVQLADELDEGNAGEAALAALVILLLLVFVQPIQR